MNYMIIIYLYLFSDWNQNITRYVERSRFQENAFEREK
jgi:hypothetical protein